MADRDAGFNLVLLRGMGLFVCELSPDLSNTSFSLVFLVSRAFSLYALFWLPFFLTTPLFALSSDLLPFPRLPLIFHSPILLFCY